MHCECIYSKVGTRLPLITRGIVMRAFVLLALGLSFGLSNTQAGEWPQFRGPGGNGVSDDKGLPAEWATDKAVKWKVKLPGVAWSCPVVWGDKVFITTAITENQRKPRSGQFGGGGGGARPGGGAERPNPERPEGQPRPPQQGGRRGSAQPPNVVYRWEVLCLDRDSGKVLWQKLALEDKPKIPTHSSNTYASETPVTDGERLYAYFGMTGLFCFDFNGNVVWKKDLGAYPMQSGWGTSSSPVLLNDRLFIQCDNERESFLVALDKMTGNEVWRAPRGEKSNWGSPYVWRNKQRTELVAAGAQKVRSYDPESGKALWELGMGGGRCCSTPVGDDELLYVGASADRGGGGGGGGRERGGDNEQPGDRPERVGAPGLYAVRAGASGDITLKQGETSNAGIAWHQPRGGPPMASPLVYQGHVYVLEQRNGMVSCYDAKTGKPAYVRERVPGAKSFWASPWAYDGKIFCLDDSGQTFVLKAGPEFKVVGKNPLDEMCWSTPALAGGTILVRGVDHLYCIKE
jgi:outer membrane protein assembly factor BamB